MKFYQFQFQILFVIHFKNIFFLQVTLPTFMFCTNVLRKCRVRLFRRIKLIICFSVFKFEVILHVLFYFYFLLKTNYNFFLIVGLQNNDKRQNFQHLENNHSNNLEMVTRIMNKCLCYFELECVCVLNLMLFFSLNFSLHNNKFYHFSSLYSTKHQDIHDAFMF